MSKTPEKDPVQVSMKQTAHIPTVLVQQRIDQDAAFGLDPETMEPGRHYHWVRETPSRISRHKMRGYRVENSNEHGVSPMLEGDESGDGRIRRGDLLLMSCPAEAHANRRKGAEELAAFRTRKAGSDVRKNARKAGVRSFRRAPEDSDEEEAL